MSKYEELIKNAKQNGLGRSEINWLKAQDKAYKEGYKKGIREAGEQFKDELTIVSNNAKFLGKELRKLIRRTKNLEVFENTWINNALNCLGGIETKKKEE